MVKLSFKTPSKDKPFELDIDLAAVTNVEQLKQKVADHTNSVVPNIKLIHKGILQLTQEKYSKTIHLSKHSNLSMGKLSMLSSRLLKANQNLPTQNQPPPTPIHKLDWEDLEEWVDLEEWEEWED